MISLKTLTTLIKVIIFLEQCFQTLAAHKTTKELFKNSEVQSLFSTNSYLINSG